MKIALQLSGQVRGKQEVFPSIKKNILGITDCDLYMYICKDRSSDGLLDLLGDLDIKIKDIKIEEDILIKKKGIRPITAYKDESIQRYYQQLYGLFKVNNMRINSGIEYDWVIRSRADLVIFKPLPNLSKLCKNRLYIPSKDWCGGLNDRFAIASSEIMNVYCNMFNWIDSLEEKGCNAEANLKKMISREGILVSKEDIGVRRAGKEEAHREKVKWMGIKGKGVMYG